MCNRQNRLPMRFASLLLVGGLLSPAVALAADGPGGQAGEGAIDMTVFYGRDLGLMLADVPTQPAIVARSDGKSASAVQQLASLDQVAADDLGQMRGGFALPGNLAVTFGFDIATSVGGNVVQSLSVPMTSITTGMTTSVPVTVTSSGAGLTYSLPVGSGAPLSVTTLANGGLTSVTTLLGGGGMTSVLKNGANNQAIQQYRVFNVSITGMNQMLAQQTVQGMVGKAISGASILRR